MPSLSQSGPTDAGMAPNESPLLNYRLVCSLSDSGDEDSDAPRLEEGGLREKITGTTLEGFSEDPFSPLDGIADDDGNILTFRAVAVGVVCGALVNASNIYLGLKSGWSISANLFASVAGFALLKSCPEYLRHLPFFGAKFGPRENNIVQTTAVAAGGMSNVFVSAFPAMYQLGLLASPAEDFWRLVTLTAVGGFFGLFFATPLRKLFIVLVPRDLHLIFPTPSATAITIRNMHQPGNESSDAPQQKMRVLRLAFAFSATLRVLSQFAVGILWNWHPFTWYAALFPSSSTSLAMESWGWYIEWSPAFIGTGMLVGLNAAVNYFAGTVLAWGVIGPLLVSYGVAFGAETSSTGIVSYYMISDEFASAGHPSPRYWLLGPGIACMIAVSLTELACQWRIFLVLARALLSSLRGITSIAIPRITERDDNKTGNIAYLGAMEDPALPEELITTRMWLPGLIATLVLGCLVMNRQYGMPILEAILAFTLAFIFSFLTIQATGATDITPLTAASTSSQVVLGAVTEGQSWAQEQVQRLSLLGGALSAIGAMQAADLTGDFRVGFLLRTSPRTQWAAQGIGTLFASVIAPGVYVLFSSAYGCINDIGNAQCPFQVPASAAWRAIAVASADPTAAIPRSSMIFGGAMACIGVTSVLVRHHLWTGRWHWVRSYHPNFMLISLGFIIPATIYATAILMGALFTRSWTRKSPASFGMYGYAVAAGCIAGEGVGGVINAAMQIAGISGDKFGTSIGCPDGIC